MVGWVWCHQRVPLLVLPRSSLTPSPPLLIRLVLRPPGFQSQKYGMPTFNTFQQHAFAILGLPCEPLALWEPVYKYIVPRFWPKTSSFWLPYHHHSSSADCARAVQGLKQIYQSSSRHSKNCFVGGCRFFVSDVVKWSSFWAILAHVTWPTAQPLGQSILLKFLSETRLKCESFELLIDFVAFLVQKLWSKINKRYNWHLANVSITTVIIFSA